MLGQHLASLFIFMFIYFRTCNIFCRPGEWLDENISSFQKAQTGGTAVNSLWEITFSYNPCLPGPSCFHGGWAPTSNLSEVSWWPVKTSWVSSSTTSRVLSRSSPRDPKWRTLTKGIIRKESSGGARSVKMDKSSYSGGGSNRCLLMESAGNEVAGGVTSE